MKKMKRIKRIVSLLMLALLSISLISCNSSKEETVEEVCSYIVKTYIEQSELLLSTEKSEKDKILNGDLDRYFKNLEYEQLLSFLTSGSYMNAELEYTYGKDWFERASWKVNYDEKLDIYFAGTLIDGKDIDETLEFALKKDGKSYVLQF